MIQLSWGNGPEAAEFVTQAANAPDRDFGEFQALCGFQNHRIVGAIIVHDWNTEAETVEVSIASISPLFPNRRAVRTVAEFVFNQMSCQAAILRTDEDNDRVRRLGRSIGASEYLIPRLRGRTASEAILIITEEAWRQSRWAGCREITKSSCAA